jgi:hypothetical protein
MSGAENVTAFDTVSPTVKWAHAAGISKLVVKYDAPGKLFCRQKKDRQARSQRLFRGGRREDARIAGIPPHF